jgi:hypothetical protein
MNVMSYRQKHTADREKYSQTGGIAMTEQEFVADETPVDLADVETDDSADESKAVDAEDEQ